MEALAVCGEEFSGSVFLRYLPWLHKVVSQIAISRPLIGAVGIGDLNNRVEWCEVAAEWPVEIPRFEHLALFPSRPFARDPFPILGLPVRSPGDLNTTIRGSNSETERPDQSF